MTVTVLKFGNSKGIIIPSRMLKSLKISERDSLEIREQNNGLFINKVDSVRKETPFSALDRWNEENGHSDDFSLEAALDYAGELRAYRVNKESSEW